MRIRSALIGLAAGVMVAAGCGDSNAPDNSHVGRYALVSVNGEPLPITVSDDPDFAVTLISGDITLNPNNTFVQTARVAFTIFGEPQQPETLSCGGQYKRRGTVLTLTSTESDNCEAATIDATITANQIVMNDQESEIVFRR